MNNMWKNGILGVVTGDALGCPVQFETRLEVASHPITGMRGYGTFHLPSGSWTDDSSLTLALLSSIRATGKIDLNHIMGNFVRWLDKGAFTPYGYAYDIGHGTLWAIKNYKLLPDPLRCGGTDDSNNGNGSLMRILPACLFCCEKQLSDDAAVEIIHQVGGLTHGHIRAKIACGLYCFMVRAVIEGSGALEERLQAGLDRGFAWYDASPVSQEELAHFARLRCLADFAETPVDDIRSNGYVVSTLEAAVWSLLNTDSFPSALLKAVNLGFDTDTVGAVCGGLAGLFYGWQAIPQDWLKALQRLEWIEDLIDGKPDAEQA